MKALHWHLRCEHDYDKEQAYVVAGAIDHEHGSGASLQKFAHGRSSSLRAEAHQRMDEIIARAKNQPFERNNEAKYNFKKSS